MTAAETNGRKPREHPLKASVRGESSATARLTTGDWRDWLPIGEPEPTADDLVTRDELLERVRESGIDFNARTFQHWEAMGALPRPLRRWHDGAVRALYPAWLALMIPLAWE